MSTNIDDISRDIGSLPNDHPAKIMGAIAVNGMWFIRYVYETNPELYRRARSFANDCTCIKGVSVQDNNGLTMIVPDEPTGEELF
jgi:hypothetical protein